jgi:hypothetical protein
VPSIIDLIKYLDAHRVDSHFPVNATVGPVRSLPSVPFRCLWTSGGVVPPPLIKLISRISTSAAPQDESKDKTSRNDDKLGAMRQIHSNKNPSWLPPITAPDLTAHNHRAGGSRMTAYNHYVTSNKQQTNDNGGSSIGTGYVEFTASEPGMFTPEPARRSRIVFDYINGRLFFSPLHYHSWIFGGGGIELISGNDGHAFTKDRPNAFYWITDITSFIGT